MKEKKGERLQALFQTLQIFLHFGKKPIAASLQNTNFSTTKSGNIKGGKQPKSGNRVANGKGTRRREVEAMGEVCYGLEALHLDSIKGKLSGSLE